MLVADLYESWIKDSLRMSGLPDPVLHTGLGLVLFGLLTLGLRGPARVPRAFAAVTAVEILNEGFDRLHYGSWRWADTSDDIVRTLVIPAVISLGVLIAGSLKRGSLKAA